MNGGQFLRCDRSGACFLRFVRTADLCRYVTTGCPNCGGSVSSALAADLAKTTAHLRADHDVEQKHRYMGSERAA